MRSNLLPCPGTSGNGVVYVQRPLVHPKRRCRNGSDFAGLRGIRSNEIDPREGAKLRSK